MLNLKKSVFNPMRAIIICFFLAINSIIMPLATIALFLVKLITPGKTGKLLLTHAIKKVVSAWIIVNYWIILPAIYKRCKMPHNMHNLKHDQWYLTICNHQTWFDIILISSAFRKHLAPPKFFMKRELLWSLPFAGVACYCMGFPFLRRHNRQQIRKNPALKNADLEMMKKSCGLFKVTPTNIIIFAEGTRFTSAKYKRQKPDYKHLLKPRAAGLALVTQELKNELTSILDVTIYYSSPPTMWKLLKGDIEHINLSFTERTITPDLYGDYYANRSFRVHYQTWLNQVWHEKDLETARLEQENQNKTA